MKRNQEAEFEVASRSDNEAAPSARCSAGLGFAEAMEGTCSPTTRWSWSRSRMTPPTATAGRFVTINGAQGAEHRRLAGQMRFGEGNCGSRPASHHLPLSGLNVVGETARRTCEVIALDATQVACGLTTRQAEVPAGDQRRLLRHPGKAQQTQGEGAAGRRAPRRRSQHAHLDGVAFDPHSPEGGVQAVSSAVRRAPDDLALSSSRSSSPAAKTGEVTLDDSSVRDGCWDVVGRCACMTRNWPDFNSLRLGLGMRGAGQRLPEEIHLNVPRHQAPELRTGPSTSMASAPWLEIFGGNSQSIKTFSTANPSGTTKLPDDGVALSWWATHSASQLCERENFLVQQVEVSLSETEWEEFVRRLKERVKPTNTALGLQVATPQRLSAPVCRQLFGRVLYREPSSFSPQARRNFLNHIVTGLKSL